MALAADGPIADIRWTRNLGLSFPSHPICEDFDFDGEAEIVVADSTGKVVLLSANKKGREIWSRKVGGAPLLAPAIGRFTDSNSLEIALIHQDGKLQILQAASGRALFEAELEALGAGKHFVLAPSLLPAVESGKRDTLLIVNEKRRLLNLSFQEKSVLVDEWANQPVRSLTEMPLQPLAVGRMLGSASNPEAYGIACVALGSKVLLINASRPDLAPAYFRSVSIGADQAPLGLVEDAGGLVRKMAVSDGSSNLLGLSANLPGTSTGEIELLGSSRIGCAQKPGSPPLIVDMNNDGVLDYVVANESRIVVADGKTGALMSGIESYLTVKRFATPPVFVKTLDGEALVIVGDEDEGIQIINLRRHKDPNQVVRIDVGKPLAPVTPLVLDADKDGLADIFFCTKTGGMLLSTSLKIPAGEIVWPAWAGSSMHSGGIPLLYVRQMTQFHRSNRFLLDQKIREAQTHLDSKEYQKAAEISSSILTIAPRNQEALSIHETSNAKLHRVSRLVHVLLALFAALLFGLLAWHWISTWRLMRRTGELADAGQKDAILEEFRKHFRFHKGQHHVVAHLAALSQKLHMTPVAFAPALEAAHRAKPQDQAILLTLARIYLQQKKCDDKAAPFYEAACKAGGDTAAYDVLLGQIYLAKNNIQDAHRLLKSAYEQDDRSPALYDGLAKVYLAIGKISARHIPVFEVAARNHPDDAQILEGLARGYVLAGQQMEPKAQKVFQRLINLKPDSVVANQEVAASCFRAGQFETAMLAARKALEGEPENSSALLVLAWCLWNKHDQGPEAREVFFKAYHHHPNDSLLLRIAAQLALEKTSAEPDTEKRILQAISANQHEREFLAEVAEAGDRWKNSAISSAALEALHGSGPLTDEQILHLAAIHVAANEKDPSHLNTLMRAFELKPDLEDLAPRIGDILIQGNCLDSQYLPVFNYLVDAECEKPKWFVHLSRIYREQGQFEAMAKTLEAVAEADATQTDVQRLLAVAHANLQQFAKAIDHYQMLLKEAPDDAEAIVGLARAYAQMDSRTDEMDATIARACGLAPDDPLLNFACGQIAVQKGKWSEAANCLTRSLRGGEDHMERVLSYVNNITKSSQGAQNIPAHWLRIQVLLFARHFGEVVSAAETIYQLNSQEATRIQDVHERILKADPRSVEALFAKGRMLKRQGKIPESVEVLESGIKIKADYEPLQRLLLDVYEESLSRKEDMALRFKMGQLALQLKEYDRAVGCFQKTRLDASLAMVSTRRLAESFLYKGLYELALQEFQNLPVDAETKPLLYLLGQEFEARRAMANARLAYQRVYAVDADYEDIADRLNRVSATTGSTAAFQGSAAAQEKSTIFEGLSESAKHRYELLEEIGRGSMGIVYRARDNELDEVVALKILPDNLSRNAEAVRRFRQEARHARKLSHENIIRIHDIGEEHGRKYISMEFVQGSTLKEIMRHSDPKLARQTILNFSRQIACAMQYAHGIGIVHRDLKPANIMVTNEGTIKVTDFGIAKAMELPQQTVAGAMVGTPLYMSPEQVLGLTMDHRADIYSFGIMFYEMLSGKPPFTSGDLAYQHMHVDPPVLQGFDPVLVQLVMRCLAKKADDRWYSFTEILTEMDRIPLDGKVA